MREETDILETLKDSEHELTHVGDDLDDLPPLTPPPTFIPPSSPSFSPSPSPPPNVSPAENSKKKKPSPFAARASAPPEEKEKPPTRPGYGRDGKPYPTPTDKYKTFNSENPDPKRRPIKALEWLRDQQPWVKDRLVIYVYRLWPVLKEPEIDEKGVKKRFKYIDKLADVPENINELRDKYGAGDYQLTINDDVVDKRTIMEVIVRENWRDTRAHPPSDKNIDDVENVELDDPANRSYVSYLKAMGKLVGQGEKGRESMAEATAVQTLGDLAKHALNRPQEKREDSSAVLAKAMDVIADAHKQGTAILTDSFKRAEDMKVHQADPMDTLEKAAGVLERFRKGDTGSGGDLTAMMQLFMSQQAETNKVITLIQNERLAFMERQLEMAQERKRPAAGGTDAEGNPIPVAAGAGGLAGAVKELAGLAQSLGWKIPGGSSVAQVVQDKTDWASMIPDILQGVNGLVSQGVRAYQTKVQADIANAQLQRGMPVHMQPPQPEPMPHPQAIQMPEAQTRGGAQAGVVGEEEEEEMNYLEFMKEITRPFLNHLNRGLGGAQFAEWMIDSYDDATYQQIKMQGPETLKMALNSYPAISKEIKGKELVVTEFVKDFMNMEEIRKEAEAEENGEEGEEYGAGGQG